MTAASPSLRVAMVCPYSLSRPGGVQGQASGLARALRDRGHQVAVIAPDDRRAVGWWFDDGDAATRDGDEPFDGTYVVGGTVGLRANGSVAPVALTPGAARRAAEVVRRRKVDVVHLHEPLAPVTGYECLWQHAVPIVATFHRSGSSPLYRGLRPLARWARRRIDVPCAVSEAARRTAIEAMGGELDVLFNGVETPRFASAIPSSTGGVPTVLFLGRHEARKGLGVLLAAFGALPAPYQLWVAGDGPETEELRRRYPASAQVTWLGLLSEEEVASRLAGADVLCAPSLGGESFGMILVEAMAAGCSVVASDIEGYRAAAGGHAALVPPGDASALAAALRTALDDAGRGTGRSAPASRAAATAHAEGWSMARLAEAYEERYLRVAPPLGGRT